MTDLAITPASVVAGTGAVTVQGTAGETITAGQVLYKKAADSKWYKADTDSATSEVRIPAGIALNGASAGQPLLVQKSGQITIGAAVLAGVAYYLSGTAGGICPVADVAAGDYTAIIGLGVSTTVLSIDIQAPNVVLA